MAATSDQSGLGWLVKHMFPLLIINVCVPLSPGFTVSKPEGEGASGWKLLTVAGV